MRRRLALFIYSLQSGGAERVLVNLANHWASIDVDVTVITIAEVTKDFYLLDKRVSRIVLDLAQGSTSFAVAARNNWNRIRYLRKQLEALRPDAAIAFTTSANILLACASIGASWVAIGSEHIWPTRSSVGLARRLFRRLGYSKLNAVVTLTSEMAQWMKSNTNARMTPVIPNPIWPISSGHPVREPSSILPSDAKVVLAVGRLEHQKGFDLLIEAFSSLGDVRCGWVLVILGEGKQRKNLEQQVDKLGLRGLVFLPGVAGNIAAWYQRAQLYVMSSRFEGFGNTLAEALACGTPAVSFNCETGPSSIVRHEVDGLLVPAENVAGLRDALRRLMSNEGQRDLFASRSIEARDRFSIQAVAQQWDGLLDRLLDSRSGA